MRGEREAPIQDDVVAFAENRGWLCRQMRYVGRRTCPDYFFFKASRLLIMEFKRAGKPDADPGQVREHRRYRLAGWTVHLINNRDDACMLLEGTTYVRD